MRASGASNPLRAKKCVRQRRRVSNFAMTSSLQLNDFDPTTFSSTQKAGFPPPRPDICPIEPNANLTIQFAKSHKTSIIPQIHIPGQNRLDSCSLPIVSTVAHLSPEASLCLVLLNTIVSIATHRVPLAQPWCRNFDGVSAWPWPDTKGLNLGSRPEPGRSHHSNSYGDCLYPLTNCPSWAPPA